MTSDKIYPGMLIRNCYGDIGWVVSLEPTEYIYAKRIDYVAYFVEWNYGSVFPTSVEKILQDHQNFLDYEKQHGYN